MPDGDEVAALDALLAERAVEPVYQRTSRGPRAAVTGSGVVGAGMAAEPEPGVRGADLAPDDPVRREWCVAVVGPHFAAALVACDRSAPPATSDLDRTFDYVLTHDRPLVLDVARSLLARTVPPANEVTDGPLVSSVGVASTPDR